MCAGKTRLLTFTIRKISGAATARNLAIDRSSGKILLFLDDDVELEREFIQRLLETYESHPDAIGASGVVTNYKAPGLPMGCGNKIFMRGPSAMIASASTGRPRLPPGSRPGR